MWILLRIWAISHHSEPDTLAQADYSVVLKDDHAHEYESPGSEATFLSLESMHEIAESCDGAEEMSPADLVETSGCFYAAGEEEEADEHRAVVRSAETEREEPSPAATAVATCEGVGGAPEVGPRQDRVSREPRIWTPARSSRRGPRARRALRRHHERRDRQPARPSVQMLLLYAQVCSR